MARLRALGRLALIACIATLALPAPAVTDSVVLTAARGVNPGDVNLQWTGQSGSVTVYRSASRSGVVSPGNRLGTTASTQWIDSPPVQSITYYDVRNVSCSDAGSCVSGFCVDGVCCDNACSGTCVACNLSGSLGSCQPIPDGSKPTPFFVDPEFVHNAFNTRLSIYATSLTQPLPASAVSLTPAGMASPITQLVWNTVPGHPQRLEAIVPSGQAAGTYDVWINDGTDCPSKLPGGLTVEAALGVTLQSIRPPFGYNAEDTSVTIRRNPFGPPGQDAPFIQTPHVFLYPTGAGPSGVGISIPSVSYVDTDRLTAFIPRGLPADIYDVVVVNPTGTIGYLLGAFRVQSTAPPSIAAVTPSSIPALSGQTVTVSGQNFNGSTIRLDCVDSFGNSVVPSVSSGADNCPLPPNCTQTATIDGSALTAGSVCVLRETNPNGAYADYSAIGVTNASLNLAGTRAGAGLNVGRRAPAAAAGNATPTARFLYVIGGDGGAASASSPFSSTEVAAMDLFGNVGAWRTQTAAPLNTPRSFAAVASMERYLYVMGGSDGTQAVASAERAMILSPQEAPVAFADDLVPAATGLDAGDWLYKIAAVFAASDPDNPGGESLGSNEVIVRVPSVSGRRIQTVVQWTAPADLLGALLPNVVGYNVYRTPLVNGPSGTEVLVAQVGGGTLQFTDDGSAVPGAQMPLPLGSTGKWRLLPMMGTARKGAGGAVGFDPVLANTFYVYTLLGLNQFNTALTSYEYLPVTIQTNGHQSVGAWTSGTSTAGSGRWQIGAWSADSSVSSTVPSGNTYVYLGGGVNAANAAVNAVDAGHVAAGGDLGTISTTPEDFISTTAGYGICAANGQLFVFGGANAAPSSDARVAVLVAPPPTLSSSSWNIEGISLLDSRYLMGSAVSGPFIFLVGGQTASSAAGTSTEIVTW